MDFDSIRARAEFLESLWHNSPFGMLHIGPDKSILNANHAFCLFLGYTTDDPLVGRNFLDIIHLDDVEATREAFEARPETSPAMDHEGLQVSFRNRYRDAWGGYVWLNWSGYGANQPDGSIVGYCKRIPEPTR